MPANKKPTTVDILTMLMQRKELAKEKIDARNLGLGHEVYWRTISLDACMLLSWIAGDDYWRIQAQQDQQSLSAMVQALDATNDSRQLGGAKIKHNCGSDDSPPVCPACERDKQAVAA